MIKNKNRWFGIYTDTEDYVRGPHTFIILQIHTSENYAQLNKKGRSQKQAETMIKWLLRNQSYRCMSVWLYRLEGKRAGEGADWRYLQGKKGWGVGEEDKGAFMFYLLALSFVPWIKLICYSFCNKRCKRREWKWSEQHRVPQALWEIAVWAVRSWRLGLVSWRRLTSSGEEALFSAKVISRRMAISGCLILSKVTCQVHYPTTEALLNL